MLFSSNKNYGINESIFINNKYICYGNFESIKYRNYRTPSDATSIDYSKKIGLLKIFNEHNERRYLANGLLKSESKTVYNLINNKSIFLSSSNFSYGYNNTYGVIDTTGTASGNISSQVLEKAILELIEKNELLLFWYGRYGYEIRQDKYIKTLIDSQNFISNQIYIFNTQNLSNADVFIVILFNEGKYVASGIAASLCSLTALKSALNEARLLEWQNFKNPSSSISYISQAEHERINNHIKNMHLECNTFTAKLNKKLEINKIISSIDVIILNNHAGTSNKTIKCCSKDLISCLPSQKNINWNSDILILRHFGLNKNEDTPNCVLL